MGFIHSYWYINMNSSCIIYFFVSINYCMSLENDSTLYRYIKINNGTYLSVNYEHVNINNYIQTMLWLNELEIHW